MGGAKRKALERTADSEAAAQHFPDTQLASQAVAEPGGRARNKASMVQVGRWKVGRDSAAAARNGADCSPLPRPNHLPAQCFPSLPLNRTPSTRRPSAPGVARRLSQWWHQRQWHQRRLRARAAARAAANEAVVRRLAAFVCLYCSSALLIINKPARHYTQLNSNTIHWRTLSVCKSADNCCCCYYSG